MVLCLVSWDIVCGSPGLSIGSCLNRLTGKVEATLFAETKNSTVLVLGQGMIQNSRLLYPTIARGLSKNSRIKPILMIILVV